MINTFHFFTSTAPRPPYQTLEMLEAFRAHLGYHDTSGIICEVFDELF